MKTAVFTIASKNYFAYVRTIMDSLERTNPQLDRYAIVCDELDDEFVSLPRNFELLEIDKLDLPHPKQMQFRYDIMEFNTAVKPFAILKLLEEYDRVVYFDPDIVLYERITPIEKALDNGASIVLTPHLNHLFEEDGLIPDEPYIMRAGIYNLGFIAVRKCPETTEMVSWWAKKLEKTCINKQSEGIFVDQKWIDLVPGLYDNVAILHDDGLNVAYWNLSHRKITKTYSGKYLINGHPLIFFHFSGVNVNDINPISKHQNRYKLTDIGVGAELFIDYAKSVLSNEWNLWKKFKYSYGDFYDGRPVLNEHRELYRNDKELQGYCGEDPFAYADIFYGDEQMILCDDGVNLVGYISSEHGAGEASRLTAECLVASGENWVGYDFEVGNSSRKKDDTYKDYIKNFMKYDISIVNVNADQFNTLNLYGPNKLKDTYRIGIWYWELPIFPDRWARAFFDIDEIWAPTKFIAESIAKKAPCPVLHMPPGLKRNMPNMSKYTREYFGLPKDTFLFLNMFDMYSFEGRKNPRGAVKAFQAAFDNDDTSVGLVLKINNVSYDDDINKRLESIIGDYKNIYIIAETLTREATNGLICTCDVSVSLHRSEGLGLLCEESMCYGKPVIATGWSGNMDFMTRENSCLVDYKLITVGKDIGPYESWQEWADPDITQASEYMKRLYTDKKYYESVSENAKSIFVDIFSPLTCGNRMKKRIEEIRAGKKDNTKRAKTFARSCLGTYEILIGRRLSESEKDSKVKHWCKDGFVDMHEIAFSVKKADSKEFANKNTRTFVEWLYKTVMDRVPTPAEIDMQYNMLKGKGDTLDDRCGLLETFLSSDEYLGSYSREYRHTINKDARYDMTMSSSGQHGASVSGELQYMFPLYGKGIRKKIKALIRRVLVFLLVPLVEHQNRINTSVMQRLSNLEAK